MNAENSPKMQRIWPCGNDLEDHRPAPYIFRKLFPEQHLHSRWYTSALFTTYKRFNIDSTQNRTKIATNLALRGTPLRISPMQRHTFYRALSTSNIIKLQNFKVDYYLKKLATKCNVPDHIIIIIHNLSVTRAQRQSGLFLCELLDLRDQASVLSNGMSLLRSEIDDLILYVCCT